MKKSHTTRFLSLVLALTLSLSLCVPASAASEFSDVSADHWAYEAIAQCVGQGTVNGYADGTFKPNDPVTSAQFIAMLTRTFYADKVAEITTPAGEPWYYPNVKVAADTGVSADMMAVDDKPINRYEMALALSNFLRANGKGSVLVPDTLRTSITDYETMWLILSWPGGIMLCAGRSHWHGGRRIPR